MWFNILTNNHGPLDAAVALAPLINFIQDALRLCGHQVTVSYDQLHRNATNIYLEGFHDEDFVDRLLSIKAEYGLKIGVIATELMVGGRIPYAEHGIIYTGGDKAKLLALRLQNFERVVKAADFTWCLLERTALDYRDRGRQVHFLPVGHTQTFQAGSNVAPKNIDVIFFGTATPHRQQTIRALQSHGIAVTAIGRGFPIGWMPAIHTNSLIDQAKIGLNLTLHAHDGQANTIDPRFVSCMRVTEMLSREICVVSETIPLDNPYKTYMQSADPSDMPDLFRQLLTTGTWAEFASSAAEAFRREMDATLICKPVFDVTVRALNS
jgi:hypothetical protein